MKDLRQWLVAGLEEKGSKDDAGQIHFPLVLLRLQLQLQTHPYRYLVRAARELHDGSRGASNFLARISSLLIIIFLFEMPFIIPILSARSVEILQK